MSGLTRIMDDSLSQTLSHQKDEYFFHCQSQFVAGSGVSDWLLQVPTFCLHSVLAVNKTRFDYLQMFIDQSIMSSDGYSIKDLESVITGVDGEIKNVKISRLTAPGENFISLVLSVDIEVEKNVQTETVNVVAKCLPALQRMTLNSVAMAHEIKWYSQVAPLIKKFGEEYGVATDFFPDYLGSRLSMDMTKTTADEDSVLLLKNIKPEGYQNIDRHLGFDLRTSKQFLQLLATFHSIPLAMKFKKPEQFKIVRECLDSVRKYPEALAPLSNTPGEPQGGLQAPALTWEKLLEIPACRRYRKNIEALKNSAKGMADIYFVPAEEPWSTMVHNDCWINNMMVKLEAGGEPRVMLMDFQICTYSSFAKDVVFFLLTSVQDEVQKNHFQDLLWYYYEQLTSKLENFAIPELKLSYAQYLEELKKVARDCEVGHAVYFTNTIFAEKGIIPDILSGEVDLVEYRYNHLNRLGARQQEKLAVIIEICVKQGWA